MYIHKVEVCYKDTKTRSAWRKKRLFSLCVMVLRSYLPAARMAPRCTVVFVMTCARRVYGRWDELTCFLSAYQWDACVFLKSNRNAFGVHWITKDALFLKKKEKGFDKKLTRQRDDFNTKGNNQMINNKRKKKRTNNNKQNNNSCILLHPSVVK